MIKPDFSAFHETTSQLAGLQKQAEREYNVVVNDLIRSNCQDANRIALTLDYLLSFAAEGECHMLYRRLCMHLYSFDPQCAAEYIRYWSEEWDEERQRFGKYLP